MNDGLRNCGIPLGGLGTGSVEIRCDGYLHEWQIMNNRPWGIGPAIDVSLDACFFGLNIRSLSGRHSAILGVPPPYVGQEFRFLNDPYAMPWVVHPESIDIQARFPFTRLQYQFPELPVKIELEAFSPFIPLDEKNSGIPVALFTFTLANTTTEPLEVSLFGAQRNLTGYCSPNSPSQMNPEESGTNCSLIRFTRNVRADAPDFGSMVLGCIGAEKEECSFLLHPRNPRDIWEPLREDGRLDNIDLGEFKGELGNVGAEQQSRPRQGLPFGVLCRTIHLDAGASESITFVLAWHFPNFIEENYPAKHIKGSQIGHMYSNWFADAREVFDYTASRLNMLRDESRAFFDAYYDGTHPQWLLDAASSQLTTLVKASWWDGQGRYGIWEGLGCCGLQTTDVIYYGSAAIIQLFPEIEKSQLRLTKMHVEDGVIPHNMPGNFSCCEIDPRQRIDLIPDFILLVWRDVLWTGDTGFAREMWPTILKALERMYSYDTDGDGLPNSKGADQTYDQFPLKGTSAFIGFVFAASLRAAADLAALLGDDTSASELRTRHERALNVLDQQLWTGDYYRLSYDPSDGTKNDGVMLDQINGDWFTKLASGNGLLPEDKVLSVLNIVLKYCSAPEGYLANCVWPVGEPTVIGRHTADQANWPWSGVEYASASHLVSVGLEDEGLRVARNVWDRYERTGLRFNHIECGGNYCRALSVWALYQAVCGFWYNGVDECLILISKPEGTQFVLTVPMGWGQVIFSTEGRLKLRLMRGFLNLRTLNLRMHRPAQVKVVVDGKIMAADITQKMGSTQVRFVDRLALAAGSSIMVEITETGVDYR